MDELFTIQNIGTISGCSLAVYLLTQLTKGQLDKLVHIHTDIVAYIYAIILLVLSQLAQGADYRDWRLYFVSMLNALIVWTTAAQIQTKTSKFSKIKKLDT